MPMKRIDLRSDTVTQPSAAMRRVMAEAEVGDDVFGDDPTVNRLQDLAAEILGTESALFVPSGTQSNLIGLMAHCERGDEYIVGASAHTYKYEGGGAAVLGSIQPQPLANRDDGTIPLEEARTAIKPKDSHFARTRLFCLENTWNGRILPMDYIRKAARFAKENRLGFHLDGARIFNASESLEIDAQEISANADTISVCLSKGLGAPVGSVLCGPVDIIERARRWRKVLGGGMRQAGIIAVAGIFALENNIQRLREDHLKAELLACGLAEIEEIECGPKQAQTNMLFIRVHEDLANALCEFLKNRNIITLPGATMRLVTHLDIAMEDITKVVNAFKDFYSTRSH